MPSPCARLACLRVGPGSGSCCSIRPGEQRHRVCPFLKLRSAVAMVSVARFALLRLSTRPAAGSLLRPGRRSHDTCPGPLTAVAPACSICCQLAVSVVERRRHARPRDRELRVRREQGRRAHAHPPARAPVGARSHHGERDRAGSVPLEDDGVRARRRRRRRDGRGGRSAAAHRPARRAAGTVLFLSSARVRISPVR